LEAAGSPDVSVDADGLHTALGQLIQGGGTHRAEPDNGYIVAQFLHAMVPGMFECSAGSAGIYDLAQVQKP
jgi:hypothetical protein